MVSNVCLVYKAINLYSVLKFSWPLIAFRTAHYSFLPEILFPWFHQYYISLWLHPCHQMFLFRIPKWTFFFLNPNHGPPPKFLPFALGSLSMHASLLGSSKGPLSLIDSVATPTLVNPKFTCTFDFSAQLCSQMDRMSRYAIEPTKLFGFPLTIIPISLNSLVFVGWLVGSFVGVGVFYLPGWKFKVIFLLHPLFTVTKSFSFFLQNVISWIQFSSPPESWPL